jgi:hypothetical protein
MSHDRSQFDSLNHKERGVVNLMWLTLVRPYVVRAYEENVLSLHVVRACKDHSVRAQPRRVLHWFFHTLGANPAGARRARHTNGANPMGCSPR